jgi:hypothetical protein
LQQGSPCLLIKKAAIRHLSRAASRHGGCPISETVTCREMVVSFLVACIVSGNAAAVAAQERLSHPRISGRRVAPLPPGEGGGLFIRAPRELCVDGKNELHLHYRLEPLAVQPILELRAGPSACEWQINDLAEGRYEAMIQVTLDGRILARTEGQVVKGVTGFMSLEPPDVEIQGYVTSDGRPRPDVVLRFQPYAAAWPTVSPVTIASGQTLTCDQPSLLRIRTVFALEVTG